MVAVAPCLPLDLANRLFGVQDNGFLRAGGVGDWGTMTAQQAKAEVLAVFKQLAAAGFEVGGHWDDDVVILISRIEGEQDYTADNWAEIYNSDLADLYGE